MRRPPSFQPSDTLFPYPTLFRSFGVKTQATIGRRSRDAGPRFRILGDHQCAGATFAHDIIEMTQELDVLQILAAAVLVRYPFTGFARVVAIEHRRNRVDAQPVDVELLQPVQAAGEHEAMHLATPEVVDQRVPNLMKHPARTFMLIPPTATIR